MAFQLISTSTASIAKLTEELLKVNGPVYACVHMCISDIDSQYKLIFAVLLAAVDGSACS